MKESSKVHRSLQLLNLSLLLTLPLAIFPLALSRRIGALLGIAVFHLMGSLRRKVMANIAPSLPALGQINSDLQKAAAHDIARQFMANFGRFLAEVIRLHFGLGRGMLERVEFRGIEHYQKASEQGRGAIFVTAHSGNWEVSALAFGLRFATMTIVVRHQRSPALTEMLSRLRGQYGNETILKDGAARKVFNVIRRGGIVAILADIAVPKREGLLTDFLGRPAWTTPMPAVIAQKTGCALLPVFIHREGERLVVVFHPPVAVEGKDTQTITQELSRHIEEHIASYPDEWFWLYHRWKGAPPPTAAA
jgi:KDO2-lipid IV(A) lauroyltransferase